MIRELNKIFKITGGKIKYLILLIIRSPFDIVSTMLNATFLMYAFNAIEQGDVNRLYIVCIAYFLGMVLLFAYNSVVWRIYSKHNISIRSKLCNRLFSKIASLPIQVLESKTQGDWITRLNEDVRLPIIGNPMHLPHAACAILNIIVSAIFLIKIDVLIFFVVIVFIVPHILITQVYIAKRMPNLMKKSLEKTAHNTDDLNALVLYADTAYLYDAKNYFMSKFKESSNNIVKAKMKMIKLKALNGALVILFGGGGYLVLLLICGQWIIDGTTTFGELTAAFQYRGGVLVGFIVFTRCMINISASKASLKRLNEIFSLKSET